VEQPKEEGNEGTKMNRITKTREKSNRNRGKEYLWK